MNKSAFNDHTHQQISHCYYFENKVVTTEDNRLSANFLSSTCTQVDEHEKLGSETGCLYKEIKYSHFIPGRLSPGTHAPLSFNLYHNVSPKISLIMIFRDVCDISHYLKYKS